MFAKQYVRNPESWELIKGHRIALADLAGVRQCGRTRITQMYIDRGIEVMSQSARVQHSSSGTKLRKVCSAMRFLGFWVVRLPLGL